MMTQPKKGALILAAAVMLAIAGLSVVQKLTQQRIANAQAQWQLDNLSAVLSDTEFDNNPVVTVRQHVASELGGAEELDIYTAYLKDKPTAVVLEVIAPDGYSGQIRLLLGLLVNGEVIAARVIEHRETPGLGDDIEYRKSNWITQVNGQSVNFSAPNNWQPASWQTTRDGGNFDAMTGATITSNAVIGAIYRALKWYTLNQHKVFQP